MGALGEDALIVSALKAFEHVARPTNNILFDTGFSYPSGHSAGCIVLLECLLVLLGGTGKARVQGL